MRYGPTGTLHDWTLRQAGHGPDGSLILVFENQGRAQSVEIPGSLSPVLWCSGICLPMIVSTIAFRQGDGFDRPEWQTTKAAVMASIDEYGMDDWYLAISGSYGGALCVLVRTPGVGTDRRVPL